MTGVEAAVANTGRTTAIGREGVVMNRTVNWAGPMTSQAGSDMFLVISKKNRFGRERKKIFPKNFKGDVHIWCLFCPVLRLKFNFY